MICWLRSSAQILQDRPGGLSRESLADTDEVYSKALKQEFVDEMRPELPQIEEVLKAVSQLRKLVFEQQELQDALVQRGVCPNGAAAQIVCKALLRFSVLGRQPKSGAPNFEYQVSGYELIPSDNLTLHRGLVKALGIS